MFRGPAHGRLLHHRVHRKIFDVTVGRGGGADERLTAIRACCTRQARDEGVSAKKVHLA